MTRDELEKLGADLSAYVDGELSPERTRAVERLLAESAEARELLEQLRGISRRLGDLPRAVVPEDLAVRVLQQYEHAQSATVVARQPSQIPALGRIARVLASAAALAFCFYTGWFMHGRVSAPPTSAARDVPLTHRAMKSDMPILSDSESETETLRVAPTRELLARGNTEPAEERSDASLGKGAAIAAADVRDLTAYETRRSEGMPTHPSGGVADDQVAVGSRLGGEPSQTMVTHNLVAAVPPVPVAELSLASLASFATDDGPPAVQVYVAPLDEEQYVATVQAVSSWQSRLAREEEPLSKAAAESERIESDRAQSFALSLSPDEVAGILNELERQAPRQVNVALSFRPADLTQVQEIVQFPAPTTVAAVEPLVAVQEQAEVQAAPPAAPAVAGAPESTPARTEAFALRAHERPRGGRAAGRSSETAVGTPATADAAQQQPRPDTPQAATIVEEKRSSTDAHTKEERTAQTRRGRTGSRSVRGGILNPAPDRQPTVAEIARPLSPQSGDAPVPTAAGVGAPAARTKENETADTAQPVDQKAAVSADAGANGSGETLGRRVTVQINIIPPSGASQPSPDSRK